MQKKSRYHFEPKKYKTEILRIFESLLKKDSVTPKDLEKVLKQNAKDKSEIFSKDQLVTGLDYLIDEELIDISDSKYKKLLSDLKMKPTRTISGVTTVTVLTKPFACPGECVFCPNDVRMPKSYIANEPGAQRALMNRFSPYLQTYNRLQALKNIGHPTEKIELLVLGGTWSSYPQKYQIWFISECFRALNDFETKQPEYKTDSSGFLYDRDDLKYKKFIESDWNDELREKVGDLPYNKLIRTQEFKNTFGDFICSEDSALPTDEAWKELFKLQETNETAKSRCVGLVLETRPDSINERESLRLRKLGATKIQLGIQTLNDDVSKKNKRGEDRTNTSKAFRLLRAAGFKIHAHMMPNLLGATPEIDRESYKELFESEDYKPDEVKIYPTSVIKHTELYNEFQKGNYKPYSTEELVDLIAGMMEMTPEYCRLTRIIRDIPSTEIEAGNKTTNLREIVEWKLQKENRANPNIRAREVKTLDIALEELTLDEIKYQTRETTEYFLQYITHDRKIAGFLRLSIPKNQKNEITNELNECGMIREIHVYGPSLEIGKGSNTEAQHIGLGTKLIERAKQITQNHNLNQLAVISSIGTRKYYQSRGFNLKQFYQIADLNDN